MMKRWEFCLRQKIILYKFKMGNVLRKYIWPREEMFCKGLKDRIRENEFNRENRYLG